MLDTLLNLLEKYNVPTDIIEMIKEKLGGELNIETVKNIIEENKDKIPNIEELTSKLDGIDGLSAAAAKLPEGSEVVNKLKDGAEVVNKFKGMFGL